MRVISFDVETTKAGSRAETALDLHRGAWVFAFSYMDSANHKARILRKDREPIRFRKAIKELWEGKYRDIPKVMHNAKFDLTASAYMGIRIPENPAAFHDTLVMSRLLHSKTRSHALKALCSDLGNYPTDDEAEVKAATRGGLGYEKVPPYLMDQYQERDAERCLLLFDLFWPLLQKDARLLRLYEVEKRVILCSMAIEARGVFLNKRKALRLIERLQGEIGAIQKTLPRGFDINKTADIREFLYKKGGLPILKRTEKAKLPSTDKDTLKELAETHPENKSINTLLKWRSYQGGLVRVQSYLDLAEPDGTLRTWINPYGAYSGRESSERPNLQNISKEINPQNPYPVPGRECFQPRPGFINFHIDFAGIEARLLIAASKDEVLMEEIRKGGDAHALAAEVFFREVFTEEQDKDIKSGIRYKAKQGFFAKSYGAGLKKLGIVLDLHPLDKVKEAAGRFQKRFPRLSNLNKELRRQASRFGFVETLFGRKIHIDPMKPYIATNNLIQAFAADIFKIAQIRVHKRLQQLTSGAWKIILPVHDELILEAPRRDLDQAPMILREVREAMIDFPELPIPMEVEVKLSTASWTKLSKFEYSKEASR